MKHINIPVDDRDYAIFYRSKVKLGCSSWNSWIRMLLAKTKQEVR